MCFIIITYILFSDSVFLFCKIRNKYATVIIIVVEDNSTFCRIFFYKISIVFRESFFGKVFKEVVI